MAPLLSIKSLNKAYGSVRALQEADFELRSGEVMALIGENGAGKSTLVKILAGIVPYDSGEMAMEGEPVSLYPSARSQAAGIAVVHQEYSLIPAMSVAENLKIGQGSARWFMARRWLNREARPWLKMVGLEELDPRTLVEDLGVAEMQLVEVARLLARDARILIFDEPTSALSDSEIGRIMAVIKRLRSEGRSVIYVTHRLAEVFDLADRVTVFRDGRSLEPVEVSDLDVDGVIEMMLGREQETMFPQRPPLSEEVLLEVEDLEVEGLEGPVSFTVRKGEIVGLTGQLGSGAQLVIQGLAGIASGVSGRVRLAGEELNLSGGVPLLDMGLAYCSADRKRNGIFAGRPIRENLSSPWLPRITRLGGWILRRDERRKVKAIAEEFAVKYNRLESTVDTLSGGNQQKVTVGRWLGAEPRLMLLEEPTRGVDVGARAEIYRRLRAVCDSGVGIVISSSDSGEVLGLADSIGSFYRGSMTDFRTWSEWTEESLTREVMHQGGRAEAGPPK